MRNSYGSLNSPELAKLIKKHHRWLKNKPFGKQLDLKYCAINNADFSGLCLAKADLSYAWFNRCNFDYADLEQANIDYTSFECCTIHGVKFSNRQRQHARIDLSCKPFYFQGHLDGSRESMADLAYQFVSIKSKDSDVKECQKALKSLANSSRFAKQIGEL